MANQSDNVSYQAYEAWRKKKQQKSMKTTGYQKWKAERDAQASSGKTDNYQAWKRKQVEELIASKPERRKEVEARQEEARRQRQIQEQQRKQETISQIRQRADNEQGGKRYGEAYKQLRDRLDQSDRAGRYHKDYVESDGSYIHIDSTPYKESAKAGLARYEADRKAAAQEPGKLWWQNRGSDAGIRISPDADIQYDVIRDMASVYERDTSWQEPDDRWDEESRRQFGLLYSQDPEQAKAYAADVNGFLDYLEKEEKRKALAQEAVDKPWLSTAKAIGAQALGGIGEYANDIAENLGRGRITERGTRLSPTEYAGAITGAISEDLNRKGVIDGGVYDRYRADEQALRDAGIDPTVHRFATDVLGRQVLDGKGYGDLYELGTSAAQSLMWAPVAKIGGAAGQLASMVSYFGQAAASGVDDARARGGSDEQAMWYGALMGLAEAQGQTQRKLIEGILASGDYAALSDEDKAKAIQYAYKYARESARIEVIPDYSGFSSKWMAEIKGDVAEAIVRKVATGTTDKYTNLSVSTAAHVTELLEGITPEAGHSGVRDIQKLEAVMADRKMTSSEKESVLKDIMGDSLEGKWNDAKSLGISSDAFVKAYRKYLDTSGKGKKQTVIRYLTGTLRMTEKKAAELYKIFSGAK